MDALPKQTHASIQRMRSQRSSIILKGLSPIRALERCMCIELQSEGLHGCIASLALALIRLSLIDSISLMLTSAISLVCCTGRQPIIEDAARILINIRNIIFD